MPPGEGMYIAAAQFETLFNLSSFFDASESLGRLNEAVGCLYNHGMWASKDRFHRGAPLQVLNNTKHATSGARDSSRLRTKGSPFATAATPCKAYNW